MVGLWYCASFDAAPDLGMLNHCRKSPDRELPLFFLRNRAGTLSLYVPPAPSADSFVRAAEQSRILPPFVRCVRPRGFALRLLFGSARAAQRYLC